LELHQPLINLFVHAGSACTALVSGVCRGAVLHHSLCTTDPSLEYFAGASTRL
jgi:hypothetical protein